ncbi:cell wall-binding repeat-containing protein [Pseudalkalibacillus hwajinpoensis]|uniref:cell wall-binding repeat-containing protein n=1 Tax=Guptibacillus hwajinpoensis TaxID=208199 RepID=UPI00325AD2DF
MKKAFGILSSALLAGSLLGGPLASASTHDELVKKAQNISLNGYDDMGYFTEVEPNNSFAQANLLMTDDIATGKLTNNDKDFYKLKVEGDEEVSLYFGAGTDEEEPSLQLQVDIYDSSMKKLTPDYEDTEWGYNADFEALAPGTYYFAVSDLANKNNGVSYYFSAFAYSDDPVVTRIAGEDRYETAVEIAKAGFEEGYTPHVVLATGANFPDALAGAPFAYQMGAPILLTNTKSIPDSVKEAFNYFGVEHVTILGGPTAVTKDVENALKKMNITFDRIAGKDRYETASLIASELDPSFSDTAFVTYGGNFPDALSVASIAATQGSPILLTKTKEVPAATAKALKNYNDTYVIGGTKVVSKEVFTKLPNAKRIAGSDRYDTSVQVVKQLDMPVDFVNLATGLNYADALTGSVLAANMYEPVLLTKKTELPEPVRNLFIDKETFYFTIFGGPNAVSEDVEDEIWSLFE